MTAGIYRRFFFRGAADLPPLAGAGFDFRGAVESPRRRGGPPSASPRSARWATPMSSRVR